MEIVKNRYGVDRVYEKLDSTRIRVMGESLLSRGSQDEEGNQIMFDFEGGPCFNVGGKILYIGMEYEITSLKSEPIKEENVASVVVGIKA